MKRYKLFLLTALFLVAALGAFAQQRIVLGGRAVPMLADAVYLFPKTSSRVVAFASSDQGLGIFMSAIDPDFKSKARFDKSAGAEVYASFKPDLVILKSMMKNQLKAPLDALGIPQLYLNLETPEQYYEDIATLGKVLGNEKRASEVVSWFASHEASIVSRTSKIEPAKRPKVLIMQLAASGESVWQVPPDSWIQTIMAERAGGQAVWKGANPGSGWATVSIEQIAAWNPDFVFIISYSGNSSGAAEAFKKDPRLSALKAVRNGSVYGFPLDFYSWDQPDTRWILGFTWLAKRVHPELFADISVARTTREFFSFMYGFDDAMFRTIIQPKIAGDLGEQF
ncbi:MAG: ABC transporter substrate-binding protein [Spirochaetota bacterium]|jgi:iron complex transport system substrate-binding protein|nr:hypothetical protein [Spirochaetaceae bacterium]